MQLTKRFGTGTVTMKTGSEGPRHDPYSYTEVTVRGTLGKRKIDITLHEGLAEWVKLGNRKPAYESQTYRPRAAFERLVGVRYTALERALNRPRQCCNKPRLESQSGFPGETLTVCIHCNAIVGGYFNEAAVI